VHFRPALFEPTHHKHMKVPCGGCQIHVTDRLTFRAVETGVAVIEALRAADPGSFKWGDPPYEYEYKKPPIDILYGSAALREGLATGTKAADLARSWEAPLQSFLETRARFLQY
jgi:uncharacterized protein YbbC (DUF1343 family)